MNFRNFTFFNPPVVRTVEPVAVGNVRNQTLTIALAGRLFDVAQWSAYPDGLWVRTSDYCKDPASGNVLDKPAEPLPKSVVAKITYKDVGILRANITDLSYNFCSKKILVNVPVPCHSDQEDFSGCFQGPFQGTNFNQSNSELEISIQLSFNGGFQFVQVPTPVRVYKKDDKCPEIGCGR
jgi:hypothetical protein